MYLTKTSNLRESFARWSAKRVGGTKTVLIVMNLTAIFLLAAALQVSAMGGSAQTVTYVAKSEPLAKVFSAIEQQSGYVFFYRKADLKDLPVISISLKDADIKTALSVVLDNQPLNYEIENNTVIISKKTASVSLKHSDNSFFTSVDPIKGVIKDSTGMPLNGATVTNKRTKKSVQTNAKGEFNIEAEEGDMLSLSFIGFESQNIRATGNSVVAILRVSNSPLDEIQIRAYGTTSKRLNTGNITTVKAAEIEKQPVNNPLLALQGRVPGLEINQSSGIPGSPVTVRLRGRNNLKTSNQEPLFIIDGLPYLNNVSRGVALYGGDFSTSSAFSWVNPNDIESIDILKDADATAIYGSRGANGVILITTKKGKIGANRLDINLQSGIGKVSRRIDLMSVEQYKQMRYEALTYRGFQFNSPYFIENPGELKAQLPDLLLWDGNHDWQKEMIGGTAQYNDWQANVSGGTTTMQYMIGGNYHKETTVFPGSSGDQKASTHFNISSVSLNQKFRVSLTGSYMTNWSRYPISDFTKYITLAPTIPDLLRADGSLNFAPYTSTSGFTRYLLEENPFQILFQPYRSNVSNLTSGADISYKILSNLVAKVNVGYSQTMGDIFMKTNPYESKAPNYTHPRISQFHSNKGNSLIVEPQLTYNPRLGQGRIDFLLGGTYQNNQTRTQSVEGRGFASDELMENLGSATQYQSRNNSSQYKYNAVFARLGYNFRDKYLIGLNSRRDGSSRFGPGKQFGNFGSVAAAWLFSEENFMLSKFRFISSGKLRFSYGTGGNDNISDYGYLEQYWNSERLYMGVRGLVSQGLFDDTRRWPLSRKAEVGFDIGLLKDRIILQTSYYRNRTTNLIVKLPLAGMAGPGDIEINSPATFQNSGVELALSTINIKSGSFEWRSSINLTMSRGKLIAFPNLEESIYKDSYKIGQPAGMILLYKFVGVDPATGVYKFADSSGNSISNVNGVPNAQQVFIDPDPKYFGGLSNTFSFKGFNLFFLFEFTKKLGFNYLFSFQQSPGYFVPAYGLLSNQPVEVLENHWKKPGDIAAMKRFNSEQDESGGILNARQSDAAYSDASYIRLKNIDLSYTIPAKMKERLHLHNLMVYVRAQNLLTFTKYKGTDPETQSVTSLPPLRVVTAGVQISL